MQVRAFASPPFDGLGRTEDYTKSGNKNSVHHQPDFNVTFGRFMNTHNVRVPEVRAVVARTRLIFRLFQMIKARNYVYALT